MLKTGTIITCDRYGCKTQHMAETPQRTREDVARWGWTSHEDGRDFCPDCTRIRAARLKLADLVPAGVRLMRAEDAVRAAGFTVADGDEEIHPICCGQPVKLTGVLGMAFEAHCEVCGAAIGSVLSPKFGESTVAFCDGDKVDVEDEAHWVVVAELMAARNARLEVDHAAF